MVDAQKGVWFDAKAAHCGLYGLVGRKTGQN
jgi:hypothetical protein